MSILAKDVVVDYAQKWLGYLEKNTNDYLEDKTKNAGFNNYTIFAKWYKELWKDNLQGQPWCAMFVSTIFYKCFKTEIFKHFAYCPDGVNYFKSQNRFFKTPQKGDIIFFTNGTRAYHTGLVVNVDNTKVYTIEGNTSDKAGVVENGGCVANKNYSLTYGKILGYGRPQYERIDKQMDELENKINNLVNLIVQLEGKINNQNNIIDTLSKDVNSLNNVMIYNYIDNNMPDWAKPTIQKLYDKKILKGNENGLGLTDDMLRILVILDRAGIFTE